MNTIIADNNKRQLYFRIFVAISLFVFVLQNFLPNSTFYFGLFVPDVVSISHTFDNMMHHGASARYLLGLYIVYFPAWLIHPSLSLAINLALMFYVFKFIEKIFTQTNTIAPSFVFLGLFVNPYLFLAVTGPNKEIPLLFATLYIIQCLIFKPKHWLVKTVFVAVFSIFIRDGYGMILLLTIFFWDMIKLKITSKWKLALIFTVVVSVSLGFLQNKFSFIDRNVTLVGEMAEMQSEAILNLSQSENPLVLMFAHILRMIYNWITLSVFPIFKVNDVVYALGIAYWIFGIFIGISIFANIFYLIKKKISSVNSLGIRLAGIVIFLWSAVSVSLFIHPRYLMPFLPIAFGVMMMHRKVLLKNLVFVYLLCMLGVIAFYSISGNRPVAYHEIEWVVPSFLLFK